MTRVVNIKFDKYDVYCGRAGKGQDGYFGNIFKNGTKEQNIDNFRIYFYDRIKNDLEYKRRVEELKGLTLGCFCKEPFNKQPYVDIPCHVDIIKAYLDNLDKIVNQSLGIVGSSGRKDDKNKLNLSMFDLMVEKSLKLINILGEKQININKLVSGGAAWSDFCSIQLFLDEKVKSLTLHFPCEFNFALNKFEDNEIGKVANFYHEAFSYTVGFDSLIKTREAIEMGAKVVVTPGFKERNTEISKESDILLAMTFGDKQKIKSSSGTWDTCKKFLEMKPNNLSYHLDLGRKLVYKGIHV